MNIEERFITESTLYFQEGLTRTTRPIYERFICRIQHLHRVVTPD